VRGGRIRMGVVDGRDGKAFKKYAGTMDSEVVE